MGVPLTRQERWIDQVLFCSDGPLLVLAFVLAWFLIATPAAAKWSESAQLLYRIVSCTAVVAGILTLRWRRPVGFVVTFAAYVVLAASQVFSSSAMCLALAGLLMIVSIFIAEAMSRVRKTSPENETHR